MTLDISHLRQLAQAATPGPWKIYDEQNRMVRISRNNGPPYQAIAAIFGWQDTDLATPDAMEHARPNATFIAACNPATVLALCDEIARLRAAIMDIKEWDRDGYCYFCQQDEHSENCVRKPA